MKRALKRKGLFFLFDKYWVNVRDRWAQKMNALTQGLSRGTLICLLVLFILSAAGYFIWNIYASFAHHAEAGKRAETQTINLK